MSDGFELRRARANRSKSSADWTPSDALREAHSDIEGKDVDGLLVLYHEKVPGGGIIPKFHASGVTYADTLLMLEMQKQRVLDDMKGES